MRSEDLLSAFDNLGQCTPSLEAEVAALVERCPAFHAGVLLLGLLRAERADNESERARLLHETAIRIPTQLAIFRALNPTEETSIPGFAEVEGDTLSDEGVAASTGNTQDAVLNELVSTADAESDNPPAASQVYEWEVASGAACDSASQHDASTASSGIDDPLAAAAAAWAGAGEDVLDGGSTDKNQPVIENSDTGPFDADSSQLDSHLGELLLGASAGAAGLSEASSSRSDASTISSGIDDPLAAAAAAWAGAGEDVLDGGSTENSLTVLDSSDTEPFGADSSQLDSDVEESVLVESDIPAASSAASSSQSDASTASSGIDDPLAAAAAAWAGAGEDIESVQEAAESDDTEEKASGPEFPVVIEFPDLYSVSSDSKAVPSSDLEESPLEVDSSSPSEVDEPNRSAASLEKSNVSDAANDLFTIDLSGVLERSLATPSRLGATLFTLDTSSVELENGDLGFVTTQLNPDYRPPRVDPDDQRGRIDSFLDDLDSMMAKMREAARAQAENPTEQVDLIAAQNDVHVDLYSERLAETLVKSGDIPGAIAMYEKLKLENREKSTYFEACIEGLRQRL